MIRKLDFWYVPNVQKNLISLGTLTKHTQKYYSEEGWVKVCQSDLLVMKGKLQQ